MQNKNNKKSSYFQKKGKNVGSLSYFQKQEKNKDMANKNTIIHVPYFFPIFSEKVLLQNVKPSYFFHLFWKYESDPTFFIFSET